MVFSAAVVLVLCQVARVHSIELFNENVGNYFQPDSGQLMQLEQQDITKVDDNTFASYTELEKIVLSRNNISEISENIFKKNKKLLIIYLDFNAISQIHKNAFASLSDLEEVHLNNNKLVSLPESLLKNNRKLQILNVNNNQIAQIEPLTFFNLPVLRELQLKNNNLTAFNARLLENSNKLENLYFSNNQISTIDYLNFRVYFPKLKIVGINENNFTCPYVKDMIEEFRPNNIIIEDLMQKPGEQSGIICQYNAEYTAVIFGREIDEIDAENQERTLAQDKLNADLIKHLKTAAENKSPATDGVVSEIINALLDLQRKKSS